ncbi:hypothetical protein [Mucilaginibacter achroorhodeus]|uniref:hypothetical protein n=1 Tax=Mucilaginibacter achroorhodeus TaxID=2599294 RepID=UPI00164809CB|nr:hypothetical protein [Mucilaginibacter achroorhodeus]
MKIFKNAFIIGSALSVSLFFIGCSKEQKIPEANETKSATIEAKKSTFSAKYW